MMSRAENGNRGASVIAQVIFAFATLAGIIIIFSAAVFFSFDIIDHDIRILALNTVPILDHVGEVQENTSLIQLAALRHILTTDKEKKEVEERNIAGAFAANASLLEKKRGLVLTPQEEQMYENVLAFGASYTKSWQHLLDLSRSGKEQEAMAYHDTMLRPAYDAYQKVLNTISAYLKTESKKRAARMDDFMGMVQRICNMLSIAGLCIAAGMGLVIIRVVKKLRQNNRILENEISQRKKAEQHQAELILELKDALDNVKQLSGLLPICAACKKIRDDQGYWQKIETYISQHSQAQFTHGICPECSEKLYPNMKKPWSG